MCIFKYVEGSHYSSPKDLYNLINYIVYAHGNSTEVNGQGICKNSSAQDIANNFIYTKYLYNKMDGRWAYHYIISEIPVLYEQERLTIEDMMSLGRYISETFFYGFQTAYAVHTNTGKVHVHIAVNSVSYINGSKLHLKKGFLYEARREIDDYTNELRMQHRDTYENLFKLS